MDKEQVFQLVGKARRAFPEWKKDYEKRRSYIYVLVEYLKNLGKQVEVASFSKSTSSKIKESVDHFFDIGKSKKYLYKK